MVYFYEDMRKDMFVMLGNFLHLDGLNELKVWFIWNGWL